MAVCAALLNMAMCAALLNMGCVCCTSEHGGVCCTSEHGCCVCCSAGSRAATCSTGTTRVPAAGRARGRTGQRMSWGRATSRTWATSRWVEVGQGEGRRMWCGVPACVCVSPTFVCRALDPPNFAMRKVVSSFVEGVGELRKLACQPATAATSPSFATLLAPAQPQVTSIAPPRPCRVRPCRTALTSCAGSWWTTPS